MSDSAQLLKWIPCLPFQFPEAGSEAQETVCLNCRANGRACVVDTRGGKVRGRDTQFQITQRRVMDCAFDGLVPGTDSDPDPERLFSDYRSQAYRNVRSAGELIWPSGFTLSKQQLAKVDGDIYEMMEAAALWNAAAVWNEYMDTGVWNSRVYSKPPNAIPSPARKIAIMKMARGADTTKLLSPSARSEYQAFEAALKSQDLELKLSTPDILGVRIPNPAPPGFELFSKQISNLRAETQDQIETAWQGIQGTLEGRHFLFAIAVKTSTRSDRLYQALFEANVLKYILGYVLRGPAIRFHAHLETFANADVAGRYKAASMTSLLTGGVPTRAVDKLFLSIRPRETAQLILDELPSYPL